jgi:hypothetical protein
MKKESKPRKKTEEKVEGIINFVVSQWVNIDDIGEDPMNPNTMAGAQHEALGKIMKLWVK